jgi:hypothetical protein
MSPPGSGRRLRVAARVRRRENPRSSATNRRSGAALGQLRRTTRGGAEEWLKMVSNRTSRKSPEAKRSRLVSRDLRLVRSEGDWGTKIGVGSKGERVAEDRCPGGPRRRARAPRGPDDLVDPDYGGVGRTKGDHGRGEVEAIFDSG